MMNHIFTITFIKKCQEQLKNREIRALPEQIAFNLMMAIVPLMIVIVQITTYFSIRQDFVKEILITYIQNEEIVSYFYNFLEDTTRPASSIFLIIITTIPFFWAISKGFYGISTAANTTYQVPLMKFAYLERIISFITVCGMVFLLIFVLIFSIFGRNLLNLFLQISEFEINEFFFSLFNVFGTVIAFLSYLGFFLLLFYLAPTIKLKMTEIFPGALVTATGWSLASIGFSFYITRIANYSLYGSLAIIIILLLWLYILGYMINIGLQVNYILKQHYFGGVTYHPRLSFKKNRFIGKWTNFEDRKANR